MTQTATYTSEITGRTYPVRQLSDGRHITVSEYGWAILEGDGQCTSEVDQEAWAIVAAWQNETRRH